MEHLKIQTAFFVILPLALLIVPWQRNQTPKECDLHCSSVLLQPQRSSKKRHLHNYEVSSCVFIQDNVKQNVPFSKTHLKLLLLNKLCL